MKLIIDIPNRAYVMTKEMKRIIDADNEGVVADAIINGTPIPDNTTNGDMLKMMFPNVFKTSCKLVDGVGYYNFSESDWWNALYQKGERNETDN